MRYLYDIPSPSLTSYYATDDYNFEGISPKTDAAYALIKKLKAKGVPIHGYGAQAHFVLGTVPSTFQKNLERFAGLGLDVALTEVDVSQIFVFRSSFLSSGANGRVFHRSELTCPSALRSSKPKQPIIPRSSPGA